ncbi:hypothetical protein ACFC0S_16260 [Streptomyces sp. NPDC056084]|uniref:hypothetical protein n=1 Tax=unclassified Streptomyces TaxID=2593676 RepID=UPI0035D55828
MKDRTATPASTEVVRGTQTATLAPARSGRLLVEYIGDMGPVTRRLDMVPVSTLVAVTGSVTALHLTGPDEEPRAVVTLTGSTSESAQCIVGTERYLDLWDLLVEGTRVRVSGRIRRPVPTEAGYIDILTIGEAPAGLATQAVSA